ncbi:MAG TPA: sigma-54 dependent transcriptional regulator [Verrucomicrobiae bacterium]|nr:sigma-54 dependent transcriptional regulator [Verrucomicrobiae bacterium]
MRLLIIDDEENIRKTTAVLLEGMGHETVGVANGAAALKQLDQSHFEIAFLDLKLDDENGLDVLPKLLKLDPQLDVVVFTAYAAIDTAVDAIRRGAVDYIPKPFTPEQIRQALDRIIKTRRLKGRVAELESRLSADSPAVDLSTSESAMQKVIDLAMKAAATPATILILGESGTGKGVLSRAIHDNSPQRENAFVTVSCPSLSRELLESELFGHVKGAFTGAVIDTWGKVAAADGGTLFLDEIGEMPLEIQPKLLRLLQEKEYERVGESKVRRASVRVIAASNRDLDQAARQGRFREDLFYRLNVITLQMPPLRERRNDLLKLAGNFLQFFAAQCGKRLNGFSPDAEQVFLSYAWPGNLRELRNVIERAVIVAAGDRIDKDDLPDRMHETSAQPANGFQVGARVSIAELEEAHIRRVLGQSSTMEEAAHVLGIDPATLYRKRKRFNL